MDLSPDGKILASASADGSVRLWDIETADRVSFLAHPASVICVTWSPKGTTLATGGGSGDNGVRLWDPTNGKLIKLLRGHTNTVLDLAWSPDGKNLASCSEDGTINVWEIESQHDRKSWRGHTTVNAVAWSADSAKVLFGSRDSVIRIWDPGQNRLSSELRAHDAAVRCVAWLPKGQVASGSDDQTIRIWDTQTQRPTNVLQGHTSSVVCIRLLDNGRLLAALGEDGTLLVWAAQNWSELLRNECVALGGPLVNFAAHPTATLIALRGALPTKINIWELDFDSLQISGAGGSSVYYVNAKAVLLGDSGVGKSALGARIAEGCYRPTPGSTHGAQFWHFPTERLPQLPEHIRGELTLWDLAGQSEYRLTHQLFLDDADAALLLFDCSDANDPFHGVHYWAKVLKKVAPLRSLRFLVSARCDVSPVTVTRPAINRLLIKYTLDDYFKTSANTGEGVTSLFERLIAYIPWEALPRTSTPRLFDGVRDYLLERKEAGDALIRIEEVRQEAGNRFRGQIRNTEIDTVIRLLQSGGLVYRVDPRPTVNLVLLRPELINQYGSSIIQAARNHTKGIGAVAERSVLTGEIPFVGFERLNPAEEFLVLEATMELLIARDLAFREMGYLVFPSQINVTRDTPVNERPRTEVAYRFSGAIETIYASLVVRLNYTEYFRYSQE